MATQQNLIDTYNSNPTLQSRYTQQQYLDLFGFGQSTPTPAPPPTTGPTPPSGPVNIIGQNLNQGGGGGGIQELQQTYTRTTPRSTPAISDISSQNLSAYLQNPALQAKYGSATEYDKFVQSQMPQPNFIQRGITGVKNFFTDSKFFQPKVAGTLGTRLADQPQLPSIFSAIFGSRSPFNKASPTYNPNLVGELNFLEGLAVDGKNMIGRDPNSGLLKYGPDSVLAGKNVISGFGSNSYEVALDNYISKMKARGTIDGVYDPANLTPAQLAKLKKAEEEKKVNTANALKIAEQNIKKEKDFVNQLGITAASTKSLTSGEGGGGGIASSGVASGKVDPSGMGGGSRQAKSSGAQDTGRTDGGWGWADGGRVYLYDRQEMANGGEAESYADIIDAYNNGVGVIEGESLTDYIRRNRIKILDPTEKANGGSVRKDYSDGGRVYLYDRQD